MQPFMKPIVLTGLLVSAITCIAQPLAIESLGTRVSDPIERAALLSRRAGTLILLGISRAGGRLVAVGERGTVVLSDDAGKSWRQAKQVPVAVSLTRVVFSAPHVGWIVGHGGVVLKSEDGGETWIRQLEGRAAARLALQSVQEAAGRHDARRAMEEAERLVADGPDKPFLDLHFFDDKNGFVIGAYGIIFRTRDGGRSWQPWMSRLDNPKGLHLNAIAQVGNALYIAGEKGLLLRSADGGEHFTVLKTPYTGSYFTVVARKGRIVIGGLRGNAYESADEGKTWTALGVPTPVTLVGSAPLAGGELVYVNQAGELLHGADGTLQRLPLPPLPPVTAVVQASDGALVAASFRGPIRLPAVP